MESQKNKLDIWASLRKEVYTTHEANTIIKRYNDLFGVEVATSHTNHISVLIKKIVKFFSFDKVHIYLLISIR